MKRYQALILSIALLLVVLASVQLIFFVLQRTQADNSEKLIQTLLRQEISSSNVFLIARTLTDLENSGLIRCVRLTEKRTNITHLDLSYKSVCHKRPFFLNGMPIASEMRSLNGDRWDIYFESVNGYFFELSLWLSRFVFGGLTVLAVWFYFAREERYLKEELKKNKLKELAEQAAHDVASPLTLLNALWASDLISDEAKELVRLIGDRVGGIVGSLREQTMRIEQGANADLQAVNLVEVVGKIVKEAQSRYATLAWEPADAVINVKAHKTELPRVISNILNNAIDASIESQKPISISIQEGRRVILNVCDEGRGIEPERLVDLGRRGNSFGKENGSGLGLYHAKTCVESWGGELHIESVFGVGTTVSIAFLI